MLVARAGAEADAPSMSQHADKDPDRAGHKFLEINPSCRLEFSSEQTLHHIIKKLFRLIP
jgi:hypothetical protein